MVADLRTVDIFRPHVGKRYTGLPVDHVDVTGFHTNYDGSPLRPEMLDIRVGDEVFWDEDGERLQASIDELVVDGPVIRVAFVNVTEAIRSW
ncbi:MAG TPA: hypothetical protein VLA19_29695 [Herpetosiphonaceae bacterium]|nr:hypothetical protein [Herpetosiphonaceae bacterium]